MSDYRKKRRIVCGMGICGTFQRSNPQKDKPSNSGDPTTPAFCRAEQEFDNIFFPFSKTFKRANKNDQGKPLPEHIPYAKTGTGAMNRKQSCKVKKTCPESDNANAASQICKAEQKFENEMRFVREW